MSLLAKQISEKSGLITAMRKSVNTTLLSLAVACGLSAQGCTAVSAGKSYPAKDISVLSKGVHRQEVIQKMGAPTSSTQDAQGGIVDTFVYRQKTGRAVDAVSAVAVDVLTLGIWELAAGPNGGWDSHGIRKKVVVHYSKELVVDEIERFVLTENE